VTSDLDIYRTASVLIREHGDEADLVAAQRADKFQKDSGMDGSSVWLLALGTCTRRSASGRCDWPVHLEALE